MPKIATWDNFPAAVRQHLIQRMRDRAISLEDLNQLRLWIESEPEVPDGDWYRSAGLTGSLPPPLQPPQLPPVAVRRPALARRFEMRRCLTLLRRLPPLLPALLRLPVERLRHRRRSAHLTQLQDLHLKHTALGLDLEHVA